jgi:hypothetical protein
VKWLTEGASSGLKIEISWGRGKRKGDYRKKAKKSGIILNVRFFTYLHAEQGSEQEAEQGSEQELYEESKKSSGAKRGAHEGGVGGAAGFVATWAVDRAICA